MITRIFRNFWFFFNVIPVAFSILFFSLNFLYLWFIAHNNQTPLITDAVEYCNGFSNDHWIDDERTYQDQCIDKFMGEEESSISSTFQIIWVLGLIMSIVGIIFIIPLSIYLLLSWRMYRYGHF